MATQEGFNEFGTEHEIPNDGPMEKKDETTGGQNLLQVDEKVAARRMFRDWERSHKRVARLIEQWKVNQARSMGFTGVTLIKSQDNAKFFVPLGAVPSVTSMNKAVRLKRRLLATLFADPPAPEVEPSSDSDEDRESAEFSKRALQVLSGPNETRYDARIRQTWNLASDYGSGFMHFWVNLFGGGRQVKTVQVRGPIPADDVSGGVPEPTTLAEGSTDPRTNMPWTGETVERMLHEDGESLTDKPEEAQRIWLPSLEIDLLTGKNVRFHPYTSLDIWDADGVSIGDLIPLSELKRRFPEKFDDLSEEEMGELVHTRPEKSKELLRVGDRDEHHDKAQGDSLVFVVTRYQVQSAEYPQGAFLVAAGKDMILNREDWYDSFNDKPLDIPLTQIKQYDEEDNSYGNGVMLYMGPANEIRASTIGTFLEWLRKFRTRKTFVPVTSTLQAKALQSPTKTVLAMSPGGQPFYEDIPELPSIVKEMLVFTTADLDDESGLQESGQAVAPSSVTSGRQLEKILDQVRVGLSELKLNAEGGILRGWSIMLQLARAFFQEQQTLSWVGDDGEYKERAWNGSDLSDNTDVIMAQGSFTLMGPELKVQLAADLMAQGFLGPEAAKRTAIGNVSPLLALGDDRHRQRVKRQIANWQNGEPEGWPEQRAKVLEEHAARVQAELEQAVSQLGPEQLQDPQVLEQLQQIANQPPPSDPTLTSLFVQLPVDEEPQVAAVRAFELGLAISSSRYARFTEEWQEGIVNEYLTMRRAAGIVTFAEQQQAEQESAQQAQSIEQQVQEGKLQEAQIKAGAEIEKVEITQAGGLQKALISAGVPPGAEFPETIAPPTLDGADQTVPGVTGERQLPGLPV